MQYELIGRAYRCCKGPRKGTIITVVDVCPPEDGDRYVLEAENSDRWTIAGETLHRKFGPADDRTCACEVIEGSASPEAVTASKRKKTPAKKVEAPKNGDTKEPLTLAREVKSGRDSQVETAPPADAPAPIMDAGQPAVASGTTQYGFNWQE